MNLLLNSLLQNILFYFRSFNDVTFNQRRHLAKESLEISVRPPQRGQENFPNSLKVFFSGVVTFLKHIHINVKMFNVILVNNKGVQISIRCSTKDGPTNKLWLKLSQCKTSYRNLDIWQKSNAFLLSIHTFFRVKF